MIMLMMLMMIKRLLDLQKPLTAHNCPPSSNIDGRSCRHLYIASSCEATYIFFFGIQLPVVLCQQASCCMPRAGEQRVLQMQALVRGETSTWP
mmetsp:Transcript_128152/g.208861  ORF Transcript_128152/g.208861 Transcript_128152/m.208861 type:complete len:93 (+) Transcript_128152:2-280(+)